MKHVNILRKSLLLCLSVISINGAFAQLSGTYKIGGATPDYPDLVTAVNDLNTSGVTGPVIFDMRNGTYTGQVTIKNVAGASNINTVTIQSETGNVNDVIVDFAPTATANNFIIRLEEASYIKLKSITITTTAATYGRLVQFIGNASYNTIEGCWFDAVGTSSNMAGIYGDDLKGTDNRIIGNTFTRGYYGIYFSGTSATLANSTKNTVIEDNKFDNVYYYSNYLYYQNNMKFRNNEINKTDDGTHYGARVYYCNNGLEFDNNKIFMDGEGTRYGLYAYYNDGKMTISNNTVRIVNTGTKYGMRIYYSDGTAADQGIVINNTVAINSGSSTAYGLYCYYSKYQNVINNSVSVNSTSATSEAARFYYSSTSYTNNEVYNNAFSNVTGDGVTLYVYSYNPAYNNIWDYNNIHNGKNLLVESGSPSGNYATLSAWVTASEQDVHSISYDPGFTSFTDLRPDPNKPASWSLNGRGLHIAGNDIDMAGNPRITSINDGAPDIGAYEFEPISEPPLAEATPSVADKGDVQVYSFGQREVATITWGQNAEVSALNIRQYSGRRAGNITTVSPVGSMYFYTDITPVGNNVNHDLSFRLHYMDIWLGNIVNENDLRLAQRVPTYPWMLHANALSNTDVNANTISAQKISRFGTFTGLPDGSIPSAFVYPDGKNTVCIGSTVDFFAEPMNGDYYKWYHNGVAIPGAEGATYTTHTASQPGDYSVVITFGNAMVESVPALMSTIAPPTAVVKANRPLTYCIGNGLELNAGTVPDVTYQWQINGVSIPGATGATYEVAEAGDYTVIVENVGCGVVSAITQVNPGPLSVSLGKDTSYCEVRNVFMKLDAGYPGATYRWNTGATTQQIEVRNEGKYWVEVNAGPNCVATDTIDISIDQLPQANGISFVQNANSYRFFPSGLVDVTGYLWIFSDGTTSTEPTPTKVINGEVYVRLVLFNACGTDTLQLGYPLSVNNMVSDEAVVVFPNPAKDNITVRIPGTAKLEEVMVVNSVGAVVAHIGGLDTTEQSVQISQLPAGQYMLRAITTNGTVTKQFSIVR